VAGPEPEGPNVTAVAPVPDDSRYIPFTQQHMCCVPTSLLMIMYRNGIPLIPAEKLGYHLGLTVAPGEANLFYSARTADAPPSAAGYGTQIHQPGYDPNIVFGKLGIPLEMRLIPASEISGQNDLLARLRTIETNDSDALLCFNNGVLNGQFIPHTGHVTVFDRILPDGTIRLVDPSPAQPKWRLAGPDVLYEAISVHGDENSGGIWHFRKQQASNGFRDNIQHQDSWL
jgi:hypothetical protein